VADDTVVDLDDEHEHDDGYEEFPEPRRRRWVLRTMLVLLLALLVAGVLGARWVERRLHPRGPVGPAVAITIPPGTSTSGIASLLEREDVVADATVFRWYVRLLGAGPFQAGDFTFERRSDMKRVVDVLERGPDVRRDRITIPEGSTLEQIAERVGQLPGRSAETFRQVAVSGQVHSQFQPAGSNNLEGLLFPDTYFVTDEDDETVILARMVQRFDDVANELGYAGAPEAVGRSPYETVIIASMIEREAKVQEDRGKISRVIYNRLQADMLLQIDATLIYALGGDRERLLNSDLESDSPFNTYRMKGLPPTPIANSGRAALQAAIAPEDGPWLFYVLADEEGRHAFAVTGEEFERLRRQAQEKGLL
jgi:UPF0755 protein